MNCPLLVARRRGDDNSCGKESARGSQKERRRYTEREMAWVPLCPPLSSVIKERKMSTIQAKIHQSA